jgi:hypothetical protein
MKERLGILYPLWLKNAHDLLLLILQQWRVVMVQTKKPLYLCVFICATLARGLLFKQAR